MPLRGIAVLVLVGLSLPVTLFHPLVGVLVWNWLAYMAPHQQTWGALGGYRLAWAVAAVTLLSTVLAGRLRPVRSRETALLGVFFLTLAISTAAAYNRPYAFDKLIQYAKILVMTYVMICLVTTERRFRVLTWSTALFVCLIGMKGAVVGPLRGFPRLFGPPESFMADNNDYALGLNMMLPFFWALAATERDKRFRLAWMASLVLTVVAVLFTYSRGGYIGLALTVLLMAWKSRRKILAAALLTVGIILGAFLAPRRLEERVSDLENPQKVDTAQDRFNAWTVAWRMGLAHPFTGVGLRNFHSLYRDYGQDLLEQGDYVKVAHSAYFQIFAEAGFPGLLVFLALIGSTLLTLRHVGQRADRLAADLEAPGDLRRLSNEALDMAVDRLTFLERSKRYVAMCQVSVLAFAATASFLSRWDFDLYVQVVGMAVALRVMVREAELAQEPTEVPLHSAAHAPAPAG